MQILNILIALISFGILPGLLLYKYIPFKKNNETQYSLYIITSIPILSFLYWLVYSQIYWIILEKFDFTVITSGLILLIIASLLLLVFKRLSQVKSEKHRLDKKVLLLGLISIVVSISILSFSYKEQSFFPINYDTQTHGTIIKNINNLESLDSKIVWLDDLEIYKNISTSFYPIGTHIYTSLWAKVIQTEPLTTLMTTITLFIILIPLLTAFVASSIFKKEKYTHYLPYIVILITPVFYYFPYGTLEWGGIAQFTSQVAMLYMIGITFNLIDNFGIYSAKTIILTGIFGILLFLIHPATAFTLLIMVIIKGWKKITDIKPLLKYPIRNLLALLVVIIIATLLLSPILSDLGTFFGTAIASNTARSFPGQDEDFFSILNFSVAFPATFRQWFINGSSLLLIPFIFQIYTWSKIAWLRFKKTNNIKIFLSTYKLPSPELLISFAILLLIIGFARGASNIPIINNITAVYYHSYRRVAYYLNIPIILISALGILNLWKCVISQEKLFATTKQKTFILNAVSFIIITFSVTGLFVKLRSDITTKDYDGEVQNAFEILHPQVKVDNAYILHLPNYYPDDRENELNWISTQDSSLIPFINRTFSSMTEELLNQRLKIANQYETNAASICTNNDLYTYDEIQLKYIYISSFDIRGQEMKDESKLDFYNRYNTELANLPCLERIVDTEHISIWEIYQ